MSKKPAKGASLPARKVKRPVTVSVNRIEASSGHEMTERIAQALETIAAHMAAAAPAKDGSDALDQADAFIWHPDGRLAPVPHVSRVDIGLLKGIDRMRDILI
jgi:predicted AAA+ superfamily ATPase